MSYRCNGQIRRMPGEGSFRLTPGHPCWRKGALGWGDYGRQLGAGVHLSILPCPVDSEAGGPCPWGIPGHPRLVGSPGFVPRGPPPPRLPPAALFAALPTPSPTLFMYLQCFAECFSSLLDLSLRVPTGLSCWLCIPRSGPGGWGPPEPSPPAQQAEGEWKSRACACHGGIITNLTCLEKEMGARRGGVLFKFSLIVY